MKKIYIALLAAFISASCGDFDKDINVDPNNPSEASAAQLITNASIALQDVSHNLSGQFLAQYLSETEYQEASLYPSTSTSFYSFYQGPLVNLQTVLDNSMGTENQQAVAKILKVFIYWHITDRWGDIPYSEALKGTEQLTPAYDTQEFIYTELFNLLDEAKAQITPGNIPDDIIYHGDMEKWQKLANSIQLLMALRLSEVNPGTGEAKFEAALASGVMTSNDDSFIFEHLNDENNQSYWFGQIDTDLGEGREWWALSGTLVDKMEPVNDPRLPVFGRPNGGNEYAGLVFGTEGFVDKSTVSLLGTAIWAQDAPVYLITYPQILFAQAEAAKNGWVGGGDLEAEAKYNEAIENSLLQWTGSTSEFAGFIAEPGVSYNPATALEQIGTQRYVHLFMNGYEAWAEWRRTGYPNNLVAPGGTLVPTRQKYTETEQFNNSENYTTAVQRQFNGEDGLYGHVWWDQ
jgi:hypothetical protein